MKSEDIPTPLSLRLLTMAPCPGLKILKNWQDPPLLVFLENRPLQSIPQNYILHTPV